MSRPGGPGGVERPASPAFAAAGVAAMPLRLLRRIPSYALNGITVAIGIGGVHLLFGAIGGLAAAQIAGSAAVCASLADLPNTVDRTAQRVFAAALLSAGAAMLVALLAPHPVALGFAVMAVAFVAMLTMAWGPRAGPVSFAPILALVFSMAVPYGSHSTLALVGYTTGGAVAYIGWSVATGALLQRRYRRLALVAALRAAANLLRSRAGLLHAAGEGRGDRTTLGRWIADEAALAERLQAARDLWFAATDAARAHRGAGILLHAIDLRDVLLASRLDLDLLGSDAVARQLLDRLGNCLGSIAAAVDTLGDAVRDRALPRAAFHVTPDPRSLVRRPAHAGRRSARAGAAAGGPAPPAHRRQRRRDRCAGARRRRGAAADAPAAAAFVGAETWPLGALRRQLRRDSPRAAPRGADEPRARHRLLLAEALPWASHPHWLVLSVAVVLRGNLEQTLTRRNARVLGTFFGCLLVVVLARWSTPGFVEIVFLASVGLAHSFVNVRYWVTATAATVMALLQSHLADPAAGFAIGERVADTLLGAALGWAFSYVLPSWERHSLPQGLARALAALDAYARRVLAPDDGDAVEQRLARRNAYDALGAVAAAVQRSVVEPRRTRLPQAEMTTLLDYGQRLMAHLSSIRLMLARSAPALREDPARMALRAAQEALTRSLAGPGEPVPTAAAEPVRLEALPEDLPTADPLPWLLRRLQLAVEDARRIRAAADAALAQLHG